MRSRSALFFAFATALFGALTAIYLRMTPERFLGAIPPDAGDPLFNLAILRWGADQLRGAAGDLWSPTFFFPIPGALTLSDHLLGPAAFVALLDALGLPPAATYNTLLLAAFALSGASAALVFRWSGLSNVAALFGALAWTFCAFRWTALSHLQVLLAFWVPWALWSFDRLLARPSAGRAATFLIFYTCHLLGGAYLAYMIHFALAAQLLVRMRASFPAWRKRSAILTLTFTGLLAFGAAAALFSPYYLEGKELGLRPGLAEITPNLVTLKSYFSVGARTIYADLWPQSLQSGSGLWFGFVALAGLFAALLIRRPVAAPAQPPVDPVWWRSLAAVGLASALVSFGALFVFLREWLPGMEAIRVPGRFFVFTSFALAAFAGRGLDVALERLRSSSPWLPRCVGCAAMTLAALEAAPRNRFTQWIPAPPLEHAPLVYSWLADRDEVRALVELPMPETWREAERMYFWSLHRRPIVNGYSAYLPESYLDLRRELLGFPTRSVASRLAQLGVSHLVLHLDQLSRRDVRQWERWQKELEADPRPWLKLLTEVESAAIYLVEAPSEVAPPGVTPVGAP